MLATHLANGFFHLVASVTRWSHVPGAVTGTLLYVPLWLLTARHASQARLVPAGGRSQFRVEAARHSRRPERRSLRP